MGETAETPGWLRFAIFAAAGGHPRRCLLVLIQYSIKVRERELANRVDAINNVLR